MSDNQNLNSQDTGFEDAPNMVPGEVVSGESLSESQGKQSKNQFAKLMLAVALLLVAGGWGFANQNEFKAALGMQTKDDFPGCTAGGSCCSHAKELTENGEPGMCCHEAKLAENAACCAEMQNKALAAALLEGVDEEANSETPAVELVVLEEDSENKEAPAEEATPETESEETKSPVEDVSVETPAAT